MTTTEQSTTKTREEPPTHSCARALHDGAMKPADYLLRAVIGKQQGPDSGGSVIVVDESLHAKSWAVCAEHLQLVLIEEFGGVAYVRALHGSTR